ncbi:MAG TPA: cytochrome ubiquinol oxidase subunit I [Candidatus Dormibacteraeota bacterium]|jgi:cytochrome bd-type quinol oxidase subunit 1|nr:cytochrome ubiquinol oxidase subunit I [Candidatus Dormibacteraeota bacterium]
MSAVGWLAVSPSPATLPNIHFPLIGAWMLGAMFLAHIVFGSFSMGAVLIAPASELLGQLRGDARLDRYAHGVASTNLKVFSLGATLGAFAVFMLTGLYPNEFISLAILFFKVLLIAFISWFLTIALLFVYTYKWEAVIDRMGRRFHIGLGFLGGASEQLFLFLIVGLDSFLLTPNDGRDFGALFNPSFWPELAHRFSGNLSWSSLLIAAVMIGYWATHREGPDRAYYGWAARVSLLVGFLLLVPQAMGGFAFAEVVRHRSPGAFRYSFTGPLAWLWQLQMGLFGLLLVGGNLYFWQSRERGRRLSAALTGLVALLAAGTVLPAAVYPGRWFWLRYAWLGAALALSLVHWLLWGPRRRGRPDPTRLGRWAVVVTGVAAVAIFLLMGVIRETARGPYAVYGRMTQAQAQNLFQPPHRGFYP